MKILLLGEYSGVFNNLSKALKDNGHEVLLVNNGDSYKSFHSDLYIDYKYFKSSSKVLNKLINIYYIILMYSGFKGCIQIFRHKKLIESMKNYDVIQLINPLFLADYGAIVNLLTFVYLKKHNKKIFLSALGDDYIWIKYCLNKNFKYSIFDRLSIKTIKQYSFPLHYIYGFMNPYLNKYVVKNVNAILPGLYDYYAAYKDFENCTEIVPIIMAVDERKEIEFTGFPIKVFHGWQPGKDIRKGNDLFDRALKKIESDYPGKIDYKIVGGVTYAEYIKTFDDCCIFIDQCYSQDCGVNALLGMKNGKVVFSGLEKPVQDYYGLVNNPIINAIPDVNQIYKDIEMLILNPNKIKAYSSRAIDFVEKFHNKNYVIDKYISIWTTK